MKITRHADCEHMAQFCKGGKILIKSLY